MPNQVYEGTLVERLSKVAEWALLLGYSEMSREIRSIAEEIEAVGGHLNAHTSREYTAFYAKVLKEDLPLAIQRRLQELLGVATGGWKCSVPAAERAISCAAIFTPTITRTSPCSALAHGGIVRIEPEVAFVLGRDLPPRAVPYSEAEVRAAIAETMGSRGASA